MRIEMLHLCGSSRIVPENRQNFHLTQHFHVQIHAEEVQEHMATESFILSAHYVLITRRWIQSKCLPTSAWIIRV